MGLVERLWGAVCAADVGGGRSTWASDWGVVTMTQGRHTNGMPSRALVRAPASPARASPARSHKPQNSAHPSTPFGAGGFPALHDNLWLGGGEGEAVATALVPKLNKTRETVEKLLFEARARGPGGTGVVLGGVRAHGLHPSRPRPHPLDLAARPFPTPPPPPHHPNTHPARWRRWRRPSRWAPMPSLSPT